MQVIIHYPANQFAMFDHKLIADYLRRSYTAVDGLWFMKVEERLDFAEALALDVAVWQIMAKIQCRKAKELLQLPGSGLADLLQALHLKFVAEEYGYQVTSQQPDRLEIEITLCPWMELLRKSKRQHLAKPVADAICLPDFQYWANEFNPQIEATLPQCNCYGAGTCRLVLELRDDRSSIGQ